MIYYAITGPGPATYTLGNRAITLDLADGETSESRSAEALTALYALAGRTPPPGVRYRPSPAPEPPPPPPDPILQIYLDRAAAAPRVMARWAAGNDVRLATFAALVQAGEFPAEPNPADFETPEEYQESLSAWLAIYDPDSFGWAPRLFASFMQQVGPVVVLLNSLAFGATAQAVQAFSHPLATPVAKASYLADMAAEGALP